MANQDSSNDIVSIKETLKNGFIVTLANGNESLLWQMQDNTEEFDKVYFEQSNNYVSIVLRKDGINAFIFSFKKEYIKSYTVRSKSEYLSYEVLSEEPGQIIFLLNKENEQSDIYVLLKNECIINDNVKKIKIVETHFEKHSSKIYMICTKDQIYLYSEGKKILFKNKIKKIRIDGTAKNCKGIYINNNLYYDLQHGIIISSNDYKIINHFFLNEYSYLVVRDKGKNKSLLLKVFSAPSNHIYISKDTQLTKQYEIIYDELEDIKRCGSFIALIYKDKFCITFENDIIYTGKNLKDLERFGKQNYKLSFATSKTHVTIELIDRENKIFSIKRVYNNTITKMLLINGDIYSKNFYKYENTRFGKIYFCKDKTIMQYNNSYFLLKRGYKITRKMSTTTFLKLFATEDITKKHEIKGEYFRFLKLNELLFDKYYFFNDNICVNFFNDKIEFQNFFNREKICIKVNYSKLINVNWKIWLLDGILNDKKVSSLTKAIIKGITQ